MIDDMKNEHAKQNESSIEVIYMFRVDGEGEEIGEPIAITLLPDGSADISHIPSALRETWETMGIRTLGGFGFVKPNDGKAFLLALLQSTTGYSRFRRSPEKV